MLIAIGSQALIRNPDEEKKYSISLDGVDDYLNVPADNLPFEMTAFTFEGWFNIPATGGFRRIFNRGEFARGEGPQAGAIELYLDGSTIRAAASGSSANVNLAVSATVETDFHLAFCGDNEGVQLYVDGVLGNESAVELGTFTMVSSPFIIIGRRRGLASQFFEATLRDLRWWSVKRSQSDIQENMHQRITSAPGLIASWPMGEGSGTVAYDVSGNRNHAEVHGATWVEVS